MPIHDWTRINAGIFHHFHHEWISALSRALNAGVLPPEYYALDDQVAGGLGPDVLTPGQVRTTDGSDGGNGAAHSAEGSNGAILLATAPPQVRFTAEAKMEQPPRKRSRIAIRHVSGDRVVCMIEIVSPGNKNTQHALHAFVGKILELLDAGVHLMIVDLFPPGARDPQGIHGAIWSEVAEDEFQMPNDKPLTLASYSSGEVKRAYIEPVAVGDVLPSMPLFLEPELYVPAPLETTYQAAFAAVPRRWRDELESGD